MSSPDSRSAADGSAATDSAGEGTAVASTTGWSPAAFAFFNVAVSVSAIGFLIWLIYFHEPPEGGAAGGTLPSFNALFNSIAAVFLVFGLRAIRRGERRVHQRWMVAAFTSSALFLINYVYYHSTQGDTLFPGTGGVRVFYLFILASHIVLSVVVFPMILTSFYLALSGRIAQHKRLSRFTWGGWMYVSVTGVLVYLMLHVLDFS